MERYLSLESYYKELDQKSKEFPLERIIRSENATAFNAIRRIEEKDLPNDEIENFSTLVLTQHDETEDKVYNFMTFSRDGKYLVSSLNAIIINDKVELCDHCKCKGLRKSRYLVIPNVDFILKKYLGFSEIYYRISTDSRFFCDGLSTNQIKKIFCEMVDYYRSEMSDTVWKYYIWNQVSDKLDRDKLVYSNTNEIPEDIMKSILPFK